MRPGLSLLFIIFDLFCAVIIFVNLFKSHKIVNEQIDTFNKTVDLYNNNVDVITTIKKVLEEDKDLKEKVFKMLKEEEKKLTEKLEKFKK